MIWKEEDLIDISKPIKKLKNALIMDLQKEYKLESIKIFTSRIIEKSLRVEFSCDCIFWQRIDEELFEYSKEWIEIAIYQQIQCRYIRIPNVNDIINLKVFIRKYDALCLCGRGDGFGSRMLNILFVKYIISHTPNFKFGFVWVPRRNIPNEVYVADKESIFHRQYLEENCYNQPLKYESKFFAGVRSITDLKFKKNFTQLFGDYQTSVFIGKSHFVDFNLNDFKEKCPSIFKDIGFSLKYRDIMESVKMNNFVALHMRCGDVVYNINQRKMYFTWRAPLNRSSPPELILSIAEELIKNKEKVVIFSDDINMALSIKKKLVSDLVYVASDLCIDGLGRFEQDFFELILMSQAKLIIAPQESTYSILASYIGNVNLLTFSDYTSPQQQYKSILQKIQFETSKLHKANSYAYLVDLAEKLSIEWQEISGHLEQLIKYDHYNSGAIFKLVDMWLNENKYLNCERLLCSLDNFSLIANDILWIRANNRYEFEKYFQNYFKFANCKTPHLSFIASKIYESQKNFEQSLKFAKISYEAEPQNEIFQKHLLTLLLQKEKVVVKEKVVIKEKPIPSIYLVAKDRIHNHLAYKLGSAMILNSKSLWGYIRMPYVLSYIKESHRIEQQKYQEKIKKNPALKLPKLESYSDYKEALREKECFTYKLGESLIAANSVRGGGANICLPCLFPKSA